ncbi:MAG TPA: acyl-CoA dehydratase activase-related protein [Syntrophomonadaceae bacterium]|nr:acyl-CoA dehydratase activase-related protein [Syntrophomonadaceae bacterium]
MSRVGIPHGLFYYYYYPLWKTFFTDLGAQVITSPDTNRSIIDSGVQLAVDEACFPIKVYFGHVKQLCNENLDYIFIPRIVSVESKSYICPKFMGIPDMVKALVPNLPEVIDLTVDLSKSDRNFKRGLFEVGRLFGNNRRSIANAYEHGMQELKFCRSLARTGFSLAEAIRIWEGDLFDIGRSFDLNIGLLGHGYSIYDSTIGMNLINHLRGLGCRVVLPEMMDRRQVEAAAATIPKRVFWTLGRKMVGSAFAMDKSVLVDGIIYVACFGCGPDSLIGEIIQRKIKQKPFMLLTVDEHTGEAGILTRLEAFSDMIRRKRSAARESNLSSYG